MQAWVWRMARDKIGIHPKCCFINMPCLKCLWLQYIPYFFISVFLTITLLNYFAEVDLDFVATKNRLWVVNMIIWYMLNEHTVLNPNYRGSKVLSYHLTFLHYCYALDNRQGILHMGVGCAVHIIISRSHCLQFPFFKFASFFFLLVVHLY